MAEGDLANITADQVPGRAKVAPHEHHHRNADPVGVQSGESDHHREPDEQEGNCTLAAQQSCHDTRRGSTGEGGGLSV